MKTLAYEFKAYATACKMVFWLEITGKREVRGDWRAKERLLGDTKGWVRCQQRPVGRSFIAQGKSGARGKVATEQETVSPGSVAHSWMPVSSWLPNAQGGYKVIS